MKKFDSAKWIIENKHGKTLSEDESFGAAGTDERTGDQITNPDLNKILQFIKSTGIDPAEVIKAIEMDSPHTNHGLPRMGINKENFEYEGSEVNEKGVLDKIKSENMSGLDLINYFKDKNYNKYQELIMSLEDNWDLELN